MSKIRSHMVVYETGSGRATVYVLVEGAVKDCAVYMEEMPDYEAFALSSDRLWSIAGHAEKVRSLDVDALPFKIPSDLTYRR